MDGLAGGGATGALRVIAGGGGGAGAGCSRGVVRRGGAAEPSSSTKCPCQTSTLSTAAARTASTRTPNAIRLTDGTLTARNRVQHGRGFPSEGLARYCSSRGAEPRTQGPECTGARAGRAARPGDSDHIAPNPPYRVPSAADEGEDVGEDRAGGEGQQCKGGDPEQPREAPGVAGQRQVRRLEGAEHALQPAFPLGLRRRFLLRRRGRTAGCCTSRLPSGERRRRA